MQFSSLTKKLKVNCNQSQHFFSRNAFLKLNKNISCKYIQGHSGLRLLEKAFHFALLPIAIALNQSRTIAWNQV